MKIRNAQILFGIFILSVSLLQLIELGHGILHHFENPIHYHKIRKVKDFKDHSIAEHHFPKMKFAHEMEESQSQNNNFIALLYGYFQELNEYQFSLNSSAQSHCTRAIENYSSVFICPPTPPPLQ
jgi:hypothetical protein